MSFYLIFQGRRLLLRTAIVFVAVCMAMSGWVGERRVNRLLVHRVRNMGQGEGFIANLYASGIILAASVMGFPVAGSRVIGDAILGVGLRGIKQAFHWPAVRNMAMAWIMASRARDSKPS